MRFLECKIDVKGCSIAVQRIAFSYGYAWKSSGTEIAYYGRAYLFFNKSGYLSCSNDSFYFQNHRYKEITLEEFFKD